MIASMIKSLRCCRKNETDSVRVKVWFGITFIEWLLTFVSRICLSLSSLLDGPIYRKPKQIICRAGEKRLVSWHRTTEQAFLLFSDLTKTGKSLKIRIECFVCFDKLLCILKLLCQSGWGLLAILYKKNSKDLGFKYHVGMYMCMRCILFLVPRTLSIFLSYNAMESTQKWTPLPS